MLNLFKKSEKEPENLEEVLTRLKKLEERYGDILKETEELKKESRKSLKKMGLVRFNPFKEIGGDQSFTIALLDDNGSGFVITSHFLREGNRVYAKPVQGGASKNQLSQEEKEAITLAISS